MKKIVFLGLFSFLFGMSHLVVAHSFHYEIQVSNELNTVGGKLKELKMTWLYGKDVSRVMIEDQTDLKKLAAKLISDLDLLGFFTQLKLNGKNIAFGKAKNVQLKETDNMLRLLFTLPLKKPVLINKGAVLSLNHEDPSAIAILYYDKPSEIIINGSLKKRCKPTVQEKGSFDEGEFPQIVKVRC